MPGVEGQWDFYPNLTLKIKHTLSACGTFYAKSHRYKKYATTTICHKSQMLSQTVQLALSGGAKGGRGQPGHVPRSGCAPAVGWPLGGRDSSSQLTKLSQAADAGVWRMRAASDVTADTPTPKHAARCNGCPVSV